MRPGSLHARRATLALQVRRVDLDADCHADIKSIRETMNRKRSPFYLHHTMELIVYFPERRTDGT